jgi:hypothetical protein
MSNTIHGGGSQQSNTSQATPGSGATSGINPVDSTSFSPEAQELFSQDPSLTSALSGDSSDMTALQGLSNQQLSQLEDSPSELSAVATNPTLIQQLANGQNPFAQQGASGAAAVPA